MNTSTNGNGHNVQSQAIERLIYLPDGRSIALKDPTTKIARRNDNVPRFPVTQPPRREVQFAPLAGRWPC